MTGKVLCIGSAGAHWSTTSHQCFFRKPTELVLSPGCGLSSINRGAANMRRANPFGSTSLIPSWRLSCDSFVKNTQTIPYLKPFHFFNGSAIPPIYRIVEFRSAAFDLPSCFPPVTRTLLRKQGELLLDIIHNVK
jgi:hypothetical protein